MESGIVKEFLVQEEAQTFKFRKGSYILDGKSKYFNMDIGDKGIWCYDFHEGLAMPFSDKISFNDNIRKFFYKVNEFSKEELKDPLKFDLDVNAELDKIEASGVIEVETALHPIIFQRIHDNKIVQAILAGATIGKVVRILILLAVIVLLIVAIDMFIDLYDSGILDSAIGQVKGE